MLKNLRRALVWFSYWPLFWVILFVFAAAWYSLLQLGSFAASDTPLAFVAIIPLFALYLLIHEGRAPAASRERSDPFVDGFIFLLIFIVCFVLVFFLPAQLSWYFWLQRLDLLVVPIFATGVVVFFWGLGGVAVLRKGLVYLLLIWPYPLIFLQQVIAPSLSIISAAFGAVVVRSLMLPIAIAANDPTRFVSTGPERFTIIISDACSGINAMIGFFVVGVPLVLTWHGRRSNKIGWLATGVFAAFISNLLRVGILLYLSANVGIDFALGTVHPVLGIVLFVGVFAGMLWLAGSFHLSYKTRSAVSIRESQLAARPEGYIARVGVAGIAALVLAVGQVSLGQFGPLAPGSVPVTSANEASALLPDLPGWSRELREEINWENLFGRGSQSRVFTYRSGEASVVVQFVATRDKGSLDTYSLEQCDVFHGDQVAGVSTVNLGHGISARLVESKFNPGDGRAILNANTLYWLMPVMVGKQEYHARIALLADTEMLPRQRLGTAQLTDNPVLHMQDWLVSTFSPYPAAMQNNEFADLDAYVISFGRLMVDGMVTKAQASFTK